MAFLESPRFPDHLAAGVSGGPEFATLVANTQSGARQALSQWALPLRRWQLQHIPVSDRASYLALLNHFMAVKGRAHGFRLRDPFDYTDDAAGFLDQGHGAGLPTLQLTKRYGLPGWYLYQPIRKPVSATLKRNGVAVAPGSGAGQATVDLTTGIVTFGADASANVSTATPGATTQIVLASSIGVLTGGALYLSGLSGSLGAKLNGQSWAVTAASGATHTLAVNTTGLTGSGGTGAKYPQPADALAWEGTFDLPVHFTADTFAPELVTADLISFPTLAIEEARQS